MLRFGVHLEEKSWKFPNGDFIPVFFMPFKGNGRLQWGVSSVLEIVLDDEGFVQNEQITSKGFERLRMWKPNYELPRSFE